MQLIVIFLAFRHSSFLLLLCNEGPLSLFLLDDSSAYLETDFGLFFMNLLVTGLLL